MQRRVSSFNLLPAEQNGGTHTHTPSHSPSDGGHNLTVNCHKLVTQELIDADESWNCDLITLFH